MTRDQSVISSAVLDALRLIVGPEDVVLEESALTAYSLDAYGRYGGDRGGNRVYAAVRPSSAQEVAEVVKLANEHRIPLVPYGGGTGVMGAINPTAGGIAVDLKGMDRVIAISAEDRTATVEPGIVLGDLNDALGREGLMLGHDPYSLPIATVGGAISTNGVGYRAAKYGSMGEQVLGLEVVLPTGGVLQTKAVPKHSVGPSLHQLFIGSEGVFGIITRATLQVFRLPEARVFGTFAFPSFDDGYHALLEIFSLGLRPALVDLSEEGDGRPVGSPGGVPAPRTIRMYLVFEGYAEEVETQVARTRSVCQGFQGEDVGETPSRDYWDTRHDSAYRYKKRFLDRPVDAPPAEGWGGWPRRTDYFHVAIPSSRVLEYRRRCEELVSQRRLWVREYSLWTEPELFSVMLTDTSPEDQRDGAELVRTSDEMLALAQDMGGSMEYVHGVGSKLTHLVSRELGVGLDVLRAIKAALDPHHVMNPGNLGL